jgi:hypothetical protein
MTKLKLIIVFIIFVNVNRANCTDKYWSSGGDIIFSFAEMNVMGSSSGNIMRFSPFFNVQLINNMDFTEYFGLFSGFSVKNIGLIYDVSPDNIDYSVYRPGTTIKKKFRNYYFGIPVGLKLGNLKKFFVFGGYEFEVPFHYKEKTFINDDKLKLTRWGVAGNRVAPYQHSVFFGIQTSFSMSVKFKYYFNDFFGTRNDRILGTNLNYRDMNANVFYFSCSFGLFSKPDKSAGIFDRDKKDKQFDL